MCGLRLIRVDSFFFFCWFRERGGDEKIVSGFPSGPSRAWSRGELLGASEFGAVCWGSVDISREQTRVPSCLLRGSWEFLPLHSAWRTQRRVKCMDYPKISAAIG